MRDNYEQSKTSLQASSVVVADVAEEWFSAFMVQLDMASVLGPSKAVAQHDGLSQAIFLASELPADALVACFQLLDWRSLCKCSCVCHTWRSLAGAPALWQQQLALQYDRPPLLQYCSQLPPTLHGLPDSVAGEAADAGQSPAGDLTSSSTSDAVAVDDTAAGCNPAPSAGRATAATTRAAVAASKSANSLEQNPKQMFAKFLAHPASAHQALLAQFHTAMTQISSWRLVIKHTQSLAAQQSLTPAVTAEELGQTRLNSLDFSYDSTQQQQQLTGHPAPLRWADLQSGVLWCIGAVQQQQQEQSCWLRFNLPAELQQDLQLVAAAAAQQLTATVQALGPSNVGWFDVITSSPFQIMDDDMDILMQSHKTGFYAWKQAPEDWPDQTADADPVPWDIEDSGITDPAAAAAHTALDGSAAAASAAQIAQRLQQAATQSVSLEDQEVEEQQQQPCKLRMLVYVHYEQLLQMLPCQLSQLLSPVSTLQQHQQQQSATQAVVLQAAAHKDTVLWLHIDVCQLHGGVRLGCCTAGLRAAGVEAGVGRTGDSCGLVEFTVQQEHVLAVLYNPAFSMNCSTGDSSRRGVATGCIGSTSAARQQYDPRSSSMYSVQCSPLAASSTTAAAEDTNMLQLVLLGQQQLLCSNTTASRTSEGLVMSSAADVLNHLLSKDEVMVDLALFDGNGRLLMGRAGVEVWSKELTTFLTPQGALDSERFADNFDGPLDGPLVVHTRTVHMLHFLVDGVESRLWDNGITVDTAASPDGPLGFSANLPLIAMKLMWPALRGLFAGHAQQQQQENGVRGLESGKTVSAITLPKLHGTVSSSKIVLTRV